LKQIGLEKYVSNASFPVVNSPDLFKLLAHDIRWSILHFLARSDYNGQELVRLLKQPQNLVSYHLRLLADKQIVTERRSSADERSIYYSLDVHALRTRYFASGEALHPILGTSIPEDDVLQETIPHLPLSPVRVLFLCTHNSARSQMAEGILRHLSAGRIDVMSAGSHPSGLHPLAVQVCASLGVDISGQRSKHLDELRDQSFDYILTVCDRVRESCPTFPGDPDRIHWSFLDPASVEGPDEERYQLFKQTGLQLMTRIRYLLTIIEREKGKPQ
jgi:ArsR family transcriptional regulator, arsenate/arsenite/antimonite-responsive transcriptional repressor / arsenate reductase (thioredoxin)